MLNQHEYSIMSSETLQVLNKISLSRAQNDIFRQYSSDALSIWKFSDNDVFWRGCLSGSDSQIRVERFFLGVGWSENEWETGWMKSRLLVLARCFVSGSFDKLKNI